LRDWPTLINRDRLDGDRTLEMSARSEPSTEPVSRRGTFVEMALNVLACNMKHQKVRCSHPALDGAEGMFPPRIASSDSAR